MERTTDFPAATGRRRKPTDVAGNGGSPKEGPRGDLCGTDDLPEHPPCPPSPTSGMHAERGIPHDGRAGSFRTGSSPPFFGIRSADPFNRLREGHRVLGGRGGPELSKARWRSSEDSAHFLGEAFFRHLEGREEPARLTIWGHRGRGQHTLPIRA